MLFNTTLRKKISDTVRLWCQRGKIRHMLESSHPDGRKVWKSVRHDMMQLIWHYGISFHHIPEQYFAVNLQRVGHDLDRYVLWKEWVRVKNILDEEAEDEIEMLGNKDHAWHYLHDRGFSVPRRLGILVMRGGVPVCTRIGGSEQLLEHLLDETGGVFAKPKDGYGGKGCLKLLPCSPNACIVNGTRFEYHEMRAVLSESLLVEELIRQHSILSSFHSQSINTLRLITMKTPGNGVELMSSILRMGANGASIDNLSNGGLAVCVDAEGCLKKNAFHIDRRLPCRKEHPDTHIPFEGCKIPFFHEAVKQVTEAHRTCKTIFIIGWDVAITQEGPVIIESNPSPGLFCHPMAREGLRSILETRLKPLALEILGQKMK